MPDETKKELLPHQQRVIDEKIELDNKRIKLESFIKERGVVFYSLPEDERNRLVRQYSCMSEYSEILAERIEAF